MFTLLTECGGYMAAASESAYIGGELDLFSLATNWKRYVKTAIGKYLVGDVLEIGAGIGGTTAMLHDGTSRRWVCLEPDVGNAKRLMKQVAERWGHKKTHVIAGSLHAVSKRSSFDCVLYMDVLEHIQDDRDQIQKAAQLVRQGGHIVILSPAHQWLFSEFDKSIGHVRRYNKKQLRSLMPPGWIEAKTTYLDSVGALLSLGNVLLLRRAMPSSWQISTWDRFCIPLSRIMDSVLMGNCGKSVLAVWRKAE
jgi:SAM-dependent methyltransferase